MIYMQSMEGMYFIKHAKTGIWRVLNSFLGYYCHSFDVNLVVASGSLEIAMHKISVVLCSGSRLKLKKDETHSEKAGLNRVDFLSEIL